MAGWRLGLFTAASGALLLSAVLFAAHPGPQVPDSTAAVTRPDRPPAAPQRASRARLKRDARRFLAAFLRYEVGELDHRGRQALRATATPGFAAELLRAPPHLWAAPSRPALLLRLSIAYFSPNPPRALITGSARRGENDEQFSFLFKARAGTWLASGLGD